MKTRKLTFGAIAGAALVGALLAPAATLAGGSGSLKTTGPGCAPTNGNVYATGDWVYLHGSGFEGSASFTWTISGLPGGASTDPGIVVATGSGTTDAAGGMCIAAYQVAAGDAGVYRASVDVSGTAKSDNYRVEPATSDTGSGGSTDTGSGGSTDPGTGGSTDPGAGGSTDPGAGGSNDPGTSAGGPTTGGSDAVVVDDSTSGGGDQPPADTSAGPTTGGSSDGGTADAPTQEVLGITSGGSTDSTGHDSRGISSGHAQLPATDTVSGGRTGGPTWIVFGLGLLVGGALLLAPRRRSSEAN